MKQQISPAVAGVIVVIILAVIGLFLFKGTGSGGSVAPGGTGNASPFGPGGVANQGMKDAMSNKK